MKMIDHNHFICHLILGTFTEYPYEVLQILSISLTDKTCLKELFEKTNFNDVKELNSSLFPGLFD